MQCIKLISIPGSERIARYAFEYARNHNRKKVTCVTKNNIMKLTDGAFYNAFKRIAAEFPDIKADHMIVDIATARVAARPTSFDVIVTLNLYGDIISDVAAEVCGSVGLAGSANIGERCAMCVIESPALFLVKARDCREIEREKNKRAIERVVLSTPVVRW